MTVIVSGIRVRRQEATTRKTCAACYEEILPSCDYFRVMWIRNKVIEMFHPPCFSEQFTDEEEFEIMPELNKELAHHCITTPFHSGCLLMHERQTLMTGNEPTRYLGRDFSELCEGKGIMDTFENRLDELMKELIEDEGSLKKSVKDQKSGVAAGVAWALAVIKHPYNPDVDKETDASMERLGYEI